MNLLPAKQVCALSVINECPSQNESLDAVDEAPAGAWPVRSRRASVNSAAESTSQSMNALLNEPIDPHGYYRSISHNGSS